MGGKITTETVLSTKTFTENHGGFIYFSLFILNLKIRPSRRRFSEYAVLPPTQPAQP